MDIVIGTHRLISKDVAFKNLGLVVIDEEQRFGVLHKERFKELFQLVDLLTLSRHADPAHALPLADGREGHEHDRDAAANRIPVETLICPYDERIIRDAIKRETERGRGRSSFCTTACSDRERARNASASSARRRGSSSATGRWTSTNSRT